MQSPILVILKPEVFDVELRNTNSDIFLPGVNFPEPDTLLSQLFEGIISEYEGPFSFSWTEDRIRSLYNQPHHFLFEPGFQKNRVDTFVDTYKGRYAEMYRAYGDDSAPDLLNLRKKEIRRKIMSHPEIAFYNMFHISDSILDAKREIAIYEKYIQG